MMDAAGDSAGAVREFERALAIHLAMAAADPANDTLTLEVASDYNRLATSQAKLGAREAALANHARAVTMTRDLQRENPANVELRVALGLALAGRADAYAGFARARASRTRADDLAAAERDYAESVRSTRLQKAGSIEETVWRRSRTTASCSRSAQARSKARTSRPSSYNRKALDAVRSG